MNKQSSLDSQTPYLLAPNNNQLESLNQEISPPNLTWSPIQCIIAIIAISLAGGLMIGLVYSLFLGLSQGIYLGITHGLVSGCLWATICFLTWEE